jgi:hypothetical protein
VWPWPSFNAVQSTCFDAIWHSDSNIIITGQSPLATKTKNNTAQRKRSRNREIAPTHKKREETDDATRLTHPQHRQQAGRRYAWSSRFAGCWDAVAAEREGRACILRR